MTKDISFKIYFSVPGYLKDTFLNSKDFNLLTSLAGLNKYPSSPSNFKKLVKSTRYSLFFAKLSPYSGRLQAKYCINSNTLLTMDINIPMDKIPLVTGPIKIKTINTDKMAIITPPVFILTYHLRLTLSSCFLAVSNSLCHWLLILSE